MVSTFGPETLGRKAVDAMPDARLHVIDTGHVPYIEQPLECARFIQPFLSDSS